MAWMVGRAAAALAAVVLQLSLLAPLVLALRAAVPPVALPPLRAQIVVSCWPGTKADRNAKYKNPPLEEIWQSERVALGVLATAGRELLWYRWPPRRPAGPDRGDGGGQSANQTLSPKIPRHRR